VPLAALVATAVTGLSAPAVGPLVHVANLQPRGGQFVPIPPARLVDTRSTTAIGANATRDVTVLGVGGIPASGVSAVALNLTIIAPTATTYLKVYPAGGAVPGTSVLNAAAGTTLANGTLVKVGTGGKVSVWNYNGLSHVAVDATGYFTDATATAAGSTFVPLTPARLIDTRSTTWIGPNATRDVQATGVGGVPLTGVTAVAVNVTAVTPSATTYLKVYPTGQTAPGTSLLNAPVGSTVANATLVKTGGDGKVRLWNYSGNTHVVVDVTGYFTDGTSGAPGSTFVPLATRLLDTRPTPIGTAGSRDVTVTGAGGVPATGVTAVALNLTAVTPTATTYLKAYPTGATAPNASVINVPAGSTLANTTVAKPGDGGKVRLWNYNGDTNVIVDVTGWFQAPATPAAPSHVTATPGDRTARVTWREPSDGGARITHYVVTAQPGGATVSVDALETVVTGLDNGVGYTFTVHAVNGAGTGATSAPTEPVFPRPPAAPAAPTVAEVVGRDGAVDVRWLPGDPGTSAVTSYTVRFSGGTVAATVAGDVTEARISGLTNGTTYRFTVTATSADGTSPASALSEPVAPGPGIVPARPIVIGVVARSGSVTVDWEPGPDGGSAITGFTVTAAPGGSSVTAAATATSATVSGLTNGTAYTFTVVARNAVGDSEPSMPSDPVTPSGPRIPGEPRDVAVASLAGGLKVSWGAPADDGGSPVTRYDVQALPGGPVVTVNAPATSVSLTGLTPTSSYTVSVVARNLVGAGPAATSVEPVKANVLVGARTLVLDPAARAALVFVGAEGTLVFEQAPAAVAALAAGDVVVSEPAPAAPDGVLRKVTGVETVGAQTRVLTTSATLEDALDEGSLAVTRDLRDAAVAEDRPAYTGAQRSGVGLRDGALVIEWNKIVAGFANGPHASVEGEVVLKPEFDLTADVSWTSVDATFTAAVKASAEVRLKAGVALAPQVSVPLRTIKFTPITFAIGPVPVVIRPELAVKLTVSGSRSVGLTAAVSWEQTFGGAVSYRDGAFSFDNVSTGPVFEAKAPNVYSAGSARVAVGPEFGLYLYGVFGPTVSADVYTELIADTSDDPWWEWRVGVEGKVGFKLKVWWFTLAEQEFTLLNLFATVAHAGGPYPGIRITPEQADLAPRGTQQFTADVAGVTWSLQAGSPGSIDASGRYTAGDDPNQTATVVATKDAFLEPRVGYATVRIGAGPPGAPAVTSVEPGRAAAAVYWNAPASNGGSPITEYLVTANPPDATATAPAGTSSAIVRGLVPGQTYQFRVQARNALGLGPASAWSAPVTVRTALVAGAKSVVAVDAAGVPDDTATAGRSGLTISGNGRYVFFGVRSTSRLVPAPYRRAADHPDAAYDVLLRRDLSTNIIEVAGLDPSGTAVPLASADASHDGETVTFASVAPPTNDYRAADGSDRYGMVYVRDLRPGTTTAIPRVNADGYSPTISSDGNVVWHRAVERTPYLVGLVRRWTRAGGASTPVNCNTAACRNVISPVATSEDGSYAVATFSDDNGVDVYRVDASGTRTLLLTDRNDDGGCCADQTGGCWYNTVIRRWDEPALGHDGSLALSGGAVPGCHGSAWLHHVTFGPSGGSTVRTLVKTTAGRYGYSSRAGFVVAHEVLKEENGQGPTDQRPVIVDLTTGAITPLDGWLGRGMSIAEYASARFQTDTSSPGDLVVWFWDGTAYLSRIL
jgi:hypothetical protein